MKILEIRLNNMANNFLSTIIDVFWRPDNIEVEETELSCDSLEDVKTIEELNKTLSSVENRAKTLERSPNAKKNMNSYKVKEESPAKQYKKAIEESIKNPFDKDKDIEL